MDETFQRLYDEIRRQMIALENINKSVNQRADKNFTNVKFKELLKEKINNILAEYLILYDLLYQILDAVDDADIQAIIVEYESGDEDE